ncbi:MAG: hypothetical protein CVV21_09910 [Candidatus Goldiibacteriota bacterium HGW-Goldbacteria-1]|jgi:hypothetical protein|nr:MAG: hypothetical protein CVV21_09910 [Candidatus Goldiibacteriota bacterium HGW-Goldbacteria-1]
MQVKTAKLGEPMKNLSLISCLNGGIKFIFVVLLTILLPSLINGAVTYNTANVYNNYLIGSASVFNYSTSVNSNRVLVLTAVVMSDSITQKINSITYGGQSFTPVTRTASGPGDGTGVSAEMWYLINPASGTAPITVSQGESSRKIIGVVEYNGVGNVGEYSAVDGNSNSLTMPFTTAQAGSHIAGIYAQKNDKFSMTFTPVTPGLISTWQRQNKSAKVYIRGYGYSLPASVAGAYSVVFNSNRTSNSALIGLELKAAFPTVVSCSPSVGYIGGANTVTITGTNFDSGCSVTVGGSPAAVTYINSTTLRIITPAHAAGPADIVITNLDGQTATGAGMFTYSSSRTPVLSSCAPVSGITLGGHTVTLSGSYFVEGCTVTIGGFLATGVAFGASQLTAVTPAHAAGLVDIVVTNPDGQYAVLPAGYTYTKPPPLVTSCTPNTLYSAGGQNVTLTGKYFVSGCRIIMEAAEYVPVFVDTMTLSFTAPAHAAGGVDVTVRNPDSQTGSLVNGLVYFGQLPPSVISCLPASGSTLGGQTVSITGLGFISGCTVSVGGTEASGVTVINSSTVQFTAPAHNAGTVDIVLTNPDTQSAVLAGGYTYAVPPSVISCVPAFGKIQGGLGITINGSNFREGCTVMMDGALIPSTRINSAQISITTTAHAAGSVDVRVSNNDNTSALLVNGFTYDANPPVISLNGADDITIAVGSVYTETAAALDDVDGDVTSAITQNITPSGAVSTLMPQVYTITYDVNDRALNSAVRLTRTVRVTDQTKPVISLNGGATVTLMAADTYIETATAADNIDGDITASMAVVIRDSGNNVVGSVSTAAPETYTITYNVSDSALNAADQMVRTVEITSAFLTGISVASPPLKQVYKTGETLDISGLVVLGNYSDSSTHNVYVTAANISGFDSSAAASGQVVTITAGVFTAYFTVDIISLDSVLITSPALKLVYDINEPLDITGMEVTGTYSDTSSEILAITPSNITGFNSAAAALSQELTVTYGGLYDTFTVDVIPSLVSIALTSEPDKLIYDIGEALNLAGLAVTGTYTDGTTKQEIISAANVTGFDSSYAVNGQVLTVTVGGKTAIFEVDIAPSLASIEITHPANKLVFNVGDVLSITGLVITGTYTDGNTKQETVTLSDVTGFNSTVPFTGQALTVTVGGKTTSYSIDIVQPLLTGIIITTPASKLIYNEGDPLDITGMVITGTYEDFSTKILPVTTDNVTGFDSSAASASQVLTVTYEGKITTYTIQIKEPAPMVDVCDPDSGLPAGNEAVILYGMNFQNGCTVTFGGAAATGVVFVDSMTLNMNTPPHAAGVVNIVVLNPDGQQGTGVAAFTYTGATATYTNTPTATVTATATLTQTTAAVPSLTGTKTGTASVTLTSTVSASVTVTKTSTQTATATVSATVTESATATVSGTSTETITQTTTGTITQTNTPTSTESPVLSPTSTSTATPTSTESPVLSPTPTSTATPSSTISPVVSATPTNTVTSTSTASPTATATATITLTNTHTPTITQTGTITPTSTITLTAAATAVPVLKPAQTGSSYVLPQPAKEFITVVYALDEQAWVKLNIYNAAGMPVAQAEHNGIASAANNITLDIKKFAPGVYYYVINAKSASGKEINFKAGKFLVVK